MTDKHCKPSVTAGDHRVTAKDAVTECSEDFMQSLDTIPSHPSFIQPLLEQGESEDDRKLLRKIRQDPDWKKRVGKMLSFESHTLKARLSWEQDKLKEQRKWLSSQKEEGESTHSGQLQQISQLKQELREQMTNRIKLESNLAEDKRINKKLIEDTNKAAKPKQKLSEVLNRTGARGNQVSVTQLDPSPAPSVETVCYAETEELSVHSSPVSEKLVLSPSLSERPSSRESTGSKSSRRDSPKRHSPSPNRSSSKLSYSLSEAISQEIPSATQSQTSVKFPKITNSPLISTQEAGASSPPRAKETSLLVGGVPCEDSALSIKSKCSHCGVKKPRKSPRDQSLYSGHTQEYQPSPSSFYSQGPAYHRPTLPSHNLHMSSPPVVIQHAPIPYTYLQPCHECVPAPQLHHYHTQHHCSPCQLHKEDTSRFNQEFEHLKEFIREEIRSGWTKSPRSRRVKTYNCTREYTVSETSTASETELENPFVSSSNVSHPSKPYKRWKGQETDSSSRSLAATHSIDSKQSEVSSVLEDELFAKLVSNPAKYSYELQEIAKLLTSPPISRASSTTSRQKLSAIKHLVREAICSYSTSELDSSDANEEEPQTEESEGNLSKLEHISSRTIHKARKAKEIKGDFAISPKPSILKTSSRLLERDITPSASLTGLKRVNFSTETIDIDNGQPTQLNNIPDDYVVVEQDEIASVTQEIREAEQTAHGIETDSKSSTNLAYPYDQYMAGELAEPCTIVQNLDKSIGPSDSHASKVGRSDAASRLLSELGIESETNSKLSISHSLELKASLPSIPSYISETESRNSVASRPNRPVQESDTPVSSNTPSLLSNSRSSLNQVVPQRDGEDELETEKRSNRSCQEVTGAREDSACVEEIPELVEIHPHRSSRRNSLTQELRRNSMGQMSRISLVSRPSVQMNATKPQSLPEEGTGPKIEKQTSKSSLASRIFSTFSSIVSLKPSGSKTSVAEQESIHSNVSNLSLASNPADNNESVSALKQHVSHVDIDTSTLEKSISNSSRQVSRQEIQKENSSVSRTGSRQEEIQKANSSVSRTGSRQEDLSTDTPPQCDCPDPTQCTDCPSEGIPEVQTNTDTTTNPVTSETDIPVKIVLFPEAETSKSAEEKETEMGVVMKFSEEWKIICTKDCPSGVEETTITDWREPSAIPQALEKSESAPNSRVSSEEFSQDTQGPGMSTRSLDSIEDQPSTVTAVPDSNKQEETVALADKEDSTIVQNESKENIPGTVEIVPEKVEENTQENNTNTVLSDRLEDNVVDKPEIHSNADIVDTETPEERYTGVVAEVGSGKENDDVTKLYSTMTAQIVTEALESITRQIEQGQRENPPLETDSGAQESNNNLQKETQEISLPDTKQA